MVRPAKDSFGAPGLRLCTKRNFPKGRPATHYGSRFASSRAPASCLVNGVLANADGADLGATLSVGLGGGGRRIALWSRVARSMGGGRASVFTSRVFRAFVARKRTNHQGDAAAHELRLRGFFVPGIRPPSVPEGQSLLRISLTCLHTDDQIDALVAALCDVAR